MSIKIIKKNLKATMKSSDFRVLVTGARGLLGKYLIKVLEAYEIVFFAFDKETLDITDFNSVRLIIEPLWLTHIINCAAYTNVAKAEVERDLCYRVNVVGVNNLVKISNKMKVEFIQISTDYVFDGVSEDGFYYPESKKNPLNYYGLTKSIAEDYIMNNANLWKIIRTSWLFGQSDENFVNKILNYSFRKKPIWINNIEIGIPTFGLDLAKLIVSNLHLSSGIYHFTNSGYTSRYQYAKQILDFTTNGEIYINNYLVSDVIRPRKVILMNHSNIENRHWMLALNEYLLDWKNYLFIE